MAIAAKAGLWGPVARVVIPAKPEKKKKKSGRIMKFPASTEKPLTGWRKQAHENKQRLFAPDKTDPETTTERSSPVVPTKPVFDMKCQNSGMKIVSGRKWPCDCPHGRNPKVRFTPGDYATDKEIEARDGYEP